MKNTLKHCLLLAFCLPVFQHTVQAQIAGMPASRAMNQELRALFANVGPPVNQPRFFYDLAAHFISKDWYVPHNTDTIDVVNWTTMYDEIWFAHYDTLQFERVDEMLNRAFGYGGDTVVLGLIDYEYVHLKDSAIESGDYFVVDTNTSPYTLIDNPNAVASPYVRDTVFAICGFQDIQTFGDITFVWDTDFLFIGPYRSIAHRSGDLNLELNFGDGNGWHAVDILSDTVFKITYETTGYHVIQARVLDDKQGGIEANLSRNSIYAPASILSTLLPDDLPDEIWTDIEGMEVEVYESCQEQAGSQLPQKFIIFAPGIDFKERKENSRRYVQYFKRTGMADLRNFGYTILVVDWDNSKDFTSSNAFRLVGLFRKLKCNYLDPDSDYQHQFVAMGTSSGAVIMRYALAWMEKHPTSTGCFFDLHHNTRLFFSFDGEHQGAYVPLAAQVLYDRITQPTPVRLTNAFMEAIAGRTLEILETPSARELMVVHHSTENNNKYTHHAWRDNLIQALGSLGNDGYPEHVKMIAVGNGLFTGEHQTGLEDDCVMQPGDLYADILIDEEMKVLGRTVATLHRNVILRALEDGENFYESEAELGVMSIDLSFEVRNWCLPIINTPCFNIAVPVLRFDTVTLASESFGQASEDVLEYDVLPGSRIGLSLSEYPEVDFGWMPPAGMGFAYDIGTYTNTQSTGGCPVRTLAGHQFRIAPDGSSGNRSLKMQTGFFCFAPNFSAIDYQDNTVPQDHDLYNENVATLMSNTPFDVIIGEVNGLDGYPQTQQPASWLPSDNKDPNQEMYPSMNRNHVSIINHLLPDTFLVDGVQIAHYLNREVGDEELWLDNLDLDRNARFQAQLEIKAGKHLNPFYEYPSAPAKEVFASYNVTTNTYDYALADNGIFSKEDPFYIDPFSTAVLIAEDSIHDVGMVVDGSVIQNLQEQLVCTETYRDPERYQKRNESSDEFITKAPEARVFPNPIKSGGIVSLQNLAQGNNSISLRSISGLIIFSETIYQNTDEYVQITIPSGLSPGVYLIQTRSGGTTETIKLLVQ